MPYNLFLDDVRNPNEYLQDTRTWETVRSYNEFVNIIQKKGLPEFISFDHDLAMEHYPFMEQNGGLGNPHRIPYETYKEKTGYDCAKWLIEFCMKIEQPLPQWQIHSMNMVGRTNIHKILSTYKHKTETLN